MWEDDQPMFIQMREISWDVTQLMVALFIFTLHKWKYWFNLFLQIWVFIALITLINTLAAFFLPEMSAQIGAAATIISISGFAGMNLLKLNYNRAKLILMKLLYKIVIKLLHVSNKVADIYKRLDNE